MCTAGDCDPATSAVVLVGRTLWSTPVSGHRAGDDEHERSKKRLCHRDTRELSASGGGGRGDDGDGHRLDFREPTGHRCELLFA